MAGWRLAFQALLSALPGWNLMAIVAGTWNRIRGAVAILLPSR